MGSQQLKEVLKKANLTPDQEKRVMEAYESNPNVISDLKIKGLTEKKKDLGKILEKLRYN